MKIQKIKIDDDVFTINLIFYSFLKKIIQSKFTDNQIYEILSIYYSNQSASIDSLKDLLYAFAESDITRGDISRIEDVFSDITQDTLELFLFALQLILVKDLLLQEAKMVQMSRVQKLAGLHQLSLAYDKISTQAAYATRIGGALLSLFFFENLSISKTNFMSEDTEIYLKDLSVTYTQLVKKGLEPNQIFTLVFTESINQSITSSAGVSYEDRISSVLISIGILKDSITKVHDSNDSSTEFDFFFKYDGRSYGISAKRTLRERYKQFIKTSHMSKLDVMIEITLGTDLRENVATAIRDHGVYIFVADEIYEQKKFLQKIHGIFPASKLSLELLKKLK